MLLRKYFFALVLALAFIAAFLAAVAIGSEAIPFRQVVRTLADRMMGGPTTSSLASTIIVDIRLPRALLAVATGGGLAVAGAGMQALVRNPLAEPFILGVSGGASVGAVIVFLGFIPILASNILALPFSAFLGGLVAVLLVYAVARKDGTVSAARLLLAGVAMSALMGAITTYLVYSAPDPNKIRSILFWLLGSFNTASWTTVWIPLSASVVATAVLWSFSRQLDALLLGEEHAATLGISTERLKKLIVAVTAFVTGSIVAFTGTIGFVGLIVPHVVRMVTGTGHRSLLPVSFVVGACFLLVVDTASRSWLPVQLPIGVVTAILGVPFFLVLLRRAEYQFG